MANILEFLRGVLTDEESRGVFRADPEGFVTRSGFGDLTGEDVLEAVAVLRRSLPAATAAALGDFEDDERLPAVRPAHDERDLDAALRVLRHAVDRTSPPGGPGAEPEPAEPRWATDPRWETEPVAAPEPVAEPEPVAVVTPAAAAPTSGPGGRSADAAIEGLRRHLAGVVEHAERDAARIRDEARRILLEAREEADRIRAEAEQGHADLEARRSELRDAERQLRDRLSDLDSVFRSVLKDDETT